MPAINSSTTRARKLAKELPALSIPQVRMLKILLEYPEGLNRSDLGERAECGDLKGSLGPINERDVKDGDMSLLALGLVKAEIGEGRGSRSIMLYSLTSRGEDAAQVYTLRERSTYPKIPKSVLDAAVLSVRNTIAYGIELFTERDITSIRSLCGPDHATLPLEEVRQQIINRRKQGAYAKGEDPVPSWYSTYRSSEHWQTIWAMVLDFWGYRCSVNHTHTIGVEVYHRRFHDNDEGTVIACETVQDCIVLCKDCAKRNLKGRLPIPKSKPE